uniref:Uncharacterized protein n=1 Tax=Leersia perrieri TaxID=77586 RepID=A0A0D9WPB8_9ORYZ
MVHGNARGLDAGAVHLPALWRLCLEHAAFSSTSFQNLMDGCQSSLELLHLIHCVVVDREDDAGSINIRGEALRRVVFDGSAGYGLVPFEVSAPNVDEFVFSGRNMVIVENGGLRRLVARKVSLLMDDQVRLYRMFAPLYFLSVGTNMARIISGFHGLLELAISVPGRLSRLRFFLMRNFTGDLNELSIVNFVRGSSYLSSIDHPDDFRVIDVFGHNLINAIKNLQLL